MALVMGVDSSTQSTKVSIHDADSGKLVASGRAAHPPTGSAPISEANPLDWWTAFQAAYGDAGAPPVAAVSVGGQQHGMVTLDVGGQPVRKAKLWNDTESAPDASWCMKQLPEGAKAWAHATGSVPVAAFTVTKLSWLHRSEPANWDRVAKVCLPHDYLTHRLTGEFTTDRGDASGTGYFSPVTNEYCWDILSIVDSLRDWSSMVPRVLGPLDVAGQWGDVTVACGTGDNMAAALGVGLQPGDVVVSIGTSGTVYSVSSTPTADPSGAVAGFADATGRYLPLVCTLNATRVTETVRRLLAVGYEEFDALAMSGNAGADGLTLVPYLDGERTPNRPHSRGMLSGISTSTSRENLARASVNGVICGLLDGLDALSAADAQTDGRLLIVGGGAQSMAYVQTLADLSGRAVTVASGDEFVAIGAARQAASAVAGGWVDWPVPSSAIVDPALAESERADVRGAFAVERDRSI